MEKISSGPHPLGMGGTHELYRMPNGYGASVIRTPYSYGGDQGLYELAVVRFKTKSNKQWELCYSTPITSDVIGHLTRRKVRAYLKAIKELPKWNR